MKVAIAGYSGLIGKHLERHLKSKKEIEIVHIEHDGDKLILNEAHLDADAVINLSGVNIMHRASDEFKEHVLASRAGTSAQINHFYDDKSQKPKVFISASAVGFYGNRPCESMIETSEKGSGFLSDLCEKWEKATFDSPINRIVVFRLGVVLAEDGGALPAMASQVKKGLGVIFGGGQEVMSWIHIDDVVKVFTQALEQSRFSGVYNLVTEAPVTQRLFVETLAKIFAKKVWIKLPKFLLKLILKDSSEIILNDTKVVPKKLKLSGYEFLYPDLESAIYSLKMRGL